MRDSRRFAREVFLERVGVCKSDGLSRVMRVHRAGRRDVRLCSYQHRVCVDTQAEIRLAGTVLQVVFGLETWTRKVGDLVLSDPGCVQAITSTLVEIGCEICI